MSGSFGAFHCPNNSSGITENMDEPIAQRDDRDSTSAAGPSSQPSQNCQYTWTSHMDTTERVRCSLPLDANRNILSCHLHLPQFEAAFLESLSPEPYWEGNEGVENLIEGNHMGGYPTGGYCTDEHLMPSRYFQGHESVFNASNVTPSQEPLGCPIAPELIPALFGLRDHHYPTSSYTEGDHVSSDHWSNCGGSENLSASPVIISASPKKPTNESYTKGDHVSSDHWSNRGRSENPSASPVIISACREKCASDLDRNSNGPKVAKTKKTYQCTEYGCGKIFGRSAELKRHENSVHKENGELFHCPHEGCERVGTNGFKRKDNLVQHLRGVHGDRIGKKSGRRSAAPRMSPWSNASNAGAGSPTMATGYEQFSQGQQGEPPVYTDQQPAVEEEGLGTPPFSRDFWENLRL